MQETRSPVGQTAGGGANHEESEFDGPDGLHTTLLKPFGVRIDGDLSLPLSTEGRAFLVSQVDRHEIVFAPKQQLTLLQHRKLLEPLGRILEKDLDYVAPDDGILGQSGMTFHSDFAFAHTPYKNLSLHAVDVVDGETSTRFANGALAYSSLSAAQHKRLASLTATAAFVTAFAETAPYDIPMGMQRFERAAVIFQPRTARPILYVSEAQTSRFNGLNRAESDAFLAELFQVLYAPAAILEHVWSVGDLLIWDNLTLQHGRPNLKSVARRRLQRVSIADVAGDEMIPALVE